MRRLIPALVLAAGALVLVVVLLAGPLSPSPDPGRTESRPTATADAAPARVSTVLSSEFEDGTDGWEGLGSAEVATREGDARSGASSLLVSGRSEAWNGALLDLEGVLTAGTEHVLSVWVRLAPGTATPEGAGDGGDAESAHAGESAADEGATDELQLTVRRDADGERVHDHLVSTPVGTDAWVELRTAYTLPEGSQHPELYVESTGTLADLLVDDVTVTKEAPPVQTDIPALRDALAGDFPVGTAVGRQDLDGAPAELLTRHFSTITPENALKPSSLQPHEGEFTFEQADQVLDFAVAHGLAVHGHTLVWHRSTPDWFFEAPDGRQLGQSPEDQALLLARLEAHVRAVAGHLQERYGDANPVRTWDVVNEAIDPEEDDGLRRNQWYAVLGPEYVAHAFRIAREVFGPDTVLYLNDYGTEGAAKRRAAADVVRRLLDEGVPVDGVGHQMHVNLGVPVSRIEDTIATFEDLGVRQAVTELDVAIARSPDEVLDRTPPERLDEQGLYYQDLLAAFRRHPGAVSSLSVWGLYDARSWLRAWPTERPYEAPLLFDGDLQAKPAYWGLVDPARLD
ncbi:endo-1,4-beta-xylanase [Cellulomonas cellasea]|uniref:Beta-xylanase n=1 Tax=Cellulomonas cellasea TaxID=43670 RepID=A0A7W4YBS0_9CELL|nr:endo-1,4-beta-xylanase [Cellulomonas cellasea]MBB2923047.1 endo-1,4-beta-xylanase [Cellulomonas cellasea]